MVYLGSRLVPLMVSPRHGMDKPEILIREVFHDSYIQTKGINCITSGTWWSNSRVCLALSCSGISCSTSLMNQQTNILLYISIRVKGKKAQINIKLLSAQRC